MELDAWVENSKVTFLALQEEGREEKRDGGSESKASWGEGIGHDRRKEGMLEANDVDEWRPRMRW